MLFSEGVCVYGVITVERFVERRRQILPASLASIREKGRSRWEATPICSFWIRI